MDTSRLWARRLFALALFISFLGIAYALLHVGLSSNAVAAGATAAIVTAAIGWVVFRAQPYDPPPVANVLRAARDLRRSSGRLMAGFFIHF